MPRAAQRRFQRSRRAARPNRCTTSTARVLGPTRAAAALGSRLSVAGSTSANTGVAPRRTIAPAVAKNENGVVTTSSPGPTPQAISAASSASVPDETPTACGMRQRRRDLALERLDLGAQDESPRRQNANSRGRQLRQQRLVMCRQVLQRHRGAWDPARVPRDKRLARARDNCWPAGDESRRSSASAGASGRSSGCRGRPRRRRGWRRRS